jgi:hypothetical protein
LRRSFTDHRRVALQVAHPGGESPAGTHASGNRWNRSPSMHIYGSDPVIDNQSKRISTAVEMPARRNC